MLQSFVDIPPGSHFPLQNLPYGAYRTASGDVHLCTALGDFIVDLFVLDESGFFDGPHLQGKHPFQYSTLNFFMSLGKPAWNEARQTLQKLLSEVEPALRDDADLRKQVFHNRESAELILPVKIGDYTDFYSSEQHARNVGTMFRDSENALLPNWKHVPVGYHGRASSVVVSGTDLHRPKGQTSPQKNEKLQFGPSQRVDFELEMGFFTGPGNALGEAIDVDKAEDHIFGLALVNDWSARDIQKWEYQPLGPFLAKNWGTSVSPWIVPMEALEPFRIPMPKQNPEPSAYLQQQNRSTFDITLDVFLKTEKQPEPVKICSSNYKHLYWSMAQQLAHHTITGCNIRPGDLLASGTISGTDEESYGSLLELAWNGTQPLKLPSGEKRTFLEDGDEVIITAYAQNDNFTIGFGEVSGRILPAK